MIKSFKLLLEINSQLLQIFLINTFENSNKLNYNNSPELSTRQEEQVLTVNIDQVHPLQQDFNHLWQQMFDLFLCSCN